jgi:hypothetical protein
VRHRPPVPHGTSLLPATTFNYWRWAASQEGGRTVALVRPAEAVPLLDAGVERSRVERSKLRRELGRLDAVCC